MTATDTVLFDAEQPELAAAVVSEAFEKSGDSVDLVVVAVGTVGNQSDDENDAVASARMITVNETWPVAAFDATATASVATPEGASPPQTVRCADVCTTTSRRPSRQARRPIEW